MSNQRRVETKSPIKDKALRLPGQALQEAIDSHLYDGMVPFLIVASSLSVLAFLEWFAVWTHLARQPWLYTAMAVAALAAGAWKFLQMRPAIKNLKLGRDGELEVGQNLEHLRADGAQVFHDIPANSFNIDHVVLSSHGIYVIETKTRSKPPHGKSQISLTEDGVLIGGHAPDRNPVDQARAGARWLSQLLEESTGRRLAVRGVVLFPGWFVEPMSKSWRSANLPWVLNPKALPAFLAREPHVLSDDEVRLAAYHLSRYVRSKQVELAMATT